MLIQVNTGNGIENTEALQRWTTDHLSETFERFQQDITRIEVQLTDENSGKAGDSDKRCMIEARLAHHQPIAVSHHGENQDEAIRGAGRKLFNALDHALGKMRDAKHRERDSIRKEDMTGVVPGAPD
jgi:ribosome-associated translation inhibitor RaiA